MRLPHGFCALPPRRVKRDRREPRAEIQSPSVVIGFLVHCEFHAQQRPRESEHKETSDLGHGVCQALKGDKLHKTNIKATTGLTCKPARVKGIGPRMSEVSDVTTLEVPLS